MLLIIYLEITGHKIMDDIILALISFINAEMFYQKYLHCRRTRWRFLCYQAFALMKTLKHTAVKGITQKK